LKNAFEKAIKDVTKAKAQKSESNFKFKDIKEAIDYVHEDFCSISELSEIYGLETSNPSHSENVSDHTLSVLENVVNHEYYKSLDETDQNILQLAAYLHDIGKGPKSKWDTNFAKGIQQPYPDHPADAIEMLQRILIEDIKDVSSYEVRMLFLLVAYHDLIGEIFEKDRNREQLIAILKTEKEFEMLNAISYADVSAISEHWAAMYSLKIRNFRVEILEKI
jgi:UTP:GlnB (protein PII) uridylyltransferase